MNNRLLLRRMQATPPVLSPFSDALSIFCLEDIGLGIQNVVNGFNASTSQNFNQNEITDGTLATFGGLGDVQASTVYNQINGNSDYSIITGFDPINIYKNGSLILQNGNPTIENLFNSGYDINNQLSFSNSSEKTLVMIFKTNQVSTNQRLFYWGVSGSSRVTCRHNGTNYDMVMNGFANSFTVSEANDYVLMWFDDINGNVTVEMNGVSKANNNLGGQNVTTEASLLSRDKATEAFEGNVQFFGIWNKNKRAEKQEIYNELNTIYNVF